MADTQVMHWASPGTRLSSFDREWRSTVAVA